MISMIKQKLSHLDLRLYLLSSNKSSFGSDDKVYTKERIKGIKSYSLLTVKGVHWSDNTTEYYLVDENNRDFYLDIEKVYPYKGQDLKIQKAYDIVSHTIILALMAAIIVWFSFDPNLSKYAFNNFHR